MQIFQPVEHHRRRTRRVLTTALALSVGLLGSSTTWWLARPGQPVDHALGVAVPDGSRQLHEEHSDGDPEQAYMAVYLSSALPVGELMERFDAIAVESRIESRRYQLADGTEIFIAPPRDIPATRLSPIHPVSDGVPLGTRAWIVISHGRPPDSTWSVSVPPYGES